MKFVMLLIMSLSIEVFASEPRKPLLKDQDFSCVVISENKRYEDIFIVELREKEFSQIKYKRKHLAAPEGEYGELELIRGCFRGRQIQEERRPNRIIVECLANGEEGLFTVDPETLIGDIYFYMPKIGYGERTLLDLKCEKK